ncbi:MAG: T9SS type A sorting domain-containing protein, partial [Taibaiella sp.]
AILTGDSVSSLFRNTQVMQTNDDGFIVGLSSSSGISGDKTDSNRSEANAMLSFLSFLLTDYWVLKLDNSGNIQWQKTFGSEDNDKFSCLLQTTDGGYIVGGTAESTYLTATGSTVSGGDKTDTIRGKGDYWILKLNAAGTISWQKTIGGSEEEQLICVDQTTDGGYILGGYSGSGISGEKTDTSRGGYDYWIVKLSATGTIDWQETIGGNGQDVLTSIKELPDGNYLVGGASSSGISGEKTENGYGGTSDFWTMKLDATGNIIWQKILGGTSSNVSHIEMPASIQQTQDGGFVTAGLSDGPVSGNKSDSCRGHYDYWIVKLLRCEADTTFASASLCGQASYELPDGATVQSPGIYYSIVPDLQGCDSVVVTNIISADVDVNVVITGNTLVADVITGATYQWISCSNSQPVPGATSNMYLPLDGAYYAVAVNLNGCKDTSMCYHITPTGIAPLTQDESILVYPNPATNIVSIQNDAGQIISQVALIEMATGKVVLSKTYTSSAHRKYDLNISEMSAGSYLLRIQTNNGNTIKHLQILK